MIGAVALVLLSFSAVGEELSWTGCGITKKAFMKEAAAAYKKKTGIKIKLFTFREAFANKF